MAKQWIGFFARLIISLILLIFLFTRINISDLVKHILNMDPLLFVLAIFFFILYLATWAYRWFLFIRNTGLKVGYIDTLRTLLVGLAVSLFLPSAVGADMGRAYDMARSRVEKVKIVSSVLMDRLIGLISLVGMSIVAIAIAGYQYLTIDIFFAIVGLALLLLVGWLVFFNILFMRRFRSLFESLPLINRVSGKIRDIYLALYYIQQDRHLFIRAVSVSAISGMFEILSVMMLAYAIGDRVDPIFFFLFLPIIWVILVIPIAIGGLGLRETVFVFFFTQVGMSDTHAVTVSLLYYSLYAVTGVVSGIIPILTHIFKRVELMNQTTSSISEET